MLNNSNRLHSAFAELAYPRSRFANLRFECTWSGLYSLVQIGTAIGSTVKSSVARDCGSCACCLQSFADHPIDILVADNWELCSSSALLIPTVWINAFIGELRNCASVLSRAMSDPVCQPSHTSLHLAHVPLSTAAQTPMSGRRPCTPWTGSTLVRVSSVPTSLPAETRKKIHGLFTSRISKLPPPASRSTLSPTWRRPHGPIAPIFAVV
jgi:hypothetical protein